MGDSLVCPYPDCVKAIGAAADGICGCDYRQPVATCGACGMRNRGGARFCRACRNMLAAEAASFSTTRGGAAGFVTMQGSFRRPPLVANGFLYGLSRAGVVTQLSPKAGARSREIGRVESSTAGFNRAAMVNVTGVAREGAVLGWTLLTVSASLVEAVSLVDGRVRRLYESHGLEAISANGSEGDATAFRGLVANGEFFAFVLRNEAGDNALTMQYMNVDRPVEQPVTLDEGQVAGPAMCDGQVVYCTRRQVGLYDCEAQGALVASFPEDFEPLLSPSSEALRIAPGSMPFAVERRRDGGHAVHVAGVRSGRAGLLRVEFEQGRTSFREVPRGSSLATGADGVACLCTLDAVETFGAVDAGVRRVRLEPGMPAYYSAPYVCSFLETDFASRHRMQLVTGSRVMDLQFEGDAWNEDSVCGVYLLGQDVAVASLDVGVSDAGAGLRFARWTPQ